MARLPSIEQLFEALSGTTRNYKKQSELIRNLREFPEATERKPMAGYYGSMNTSMEDEAQILGALEGVSYGAPQGSVLRQQSKTANNRVKQSIPLLEKYIELRKTGLGHNDALDVVNGLLKQNVKDPDWRLKRTFSGFYGGNRTAPMSEDGTEQIDPRRLMK